MNMPLAEKKESSVFTSHIGLLITTTIWASTFINIKIVLEQVQPNTLAFLRFFIASIVLLGYSLITRQSFIKKEDLIWAAASGVTGVALYNLFQNQGLKYAGATDAAIIASMAPVFMALLAWLILKESITKQQILGILIAFTGSSLVATNGSLDTFNLDPTRLWGDFLILLTGLAWGLYNISLKKLLGKYSPTTVLTSTTLAGTIALFPAMLIEQPLNLGSVNTWGWINVFYLGLLASALAYLLWNRALTVVSTVTAGAYLYLLPVIAAIIAFVFLGEVPGLFTIIGGVMALVGTYLAGK